MAKPIRSKRKIFLAAVLLLLAVCVIGSWIYVSDYYHAEPEAVAAMAAADDIQISATEKNMLVFAPKDAKAGLIFYPGGKVEYTAYAPLLQAFAKEGILCVLVKMPGNLAVLDINAAEGIQAQFPEIDRWYMGGHSLGGSMAASYVSKHTDAYEGLLLLASYSTADLSGSDLQVFSLYGTEDHVLGLDAYEENRSNLPAATIEEIIEGGCHAQFGAYGPQDGDGTPTISMEEQIKSVIDCCVPVMLDSAA